LAAAVVVAASATTTTMDRHHRALPLRSQYSLSDLVLASATRELHVGVSSGEKESPEMIELQKHYIKCLDEASESLAFKHLSMSIQLASNLSAQDTEPFVHIFSSLPDQGTGTLDLLYARKRIMQEVMFSSGEQTRSFKSMERSEKALNEQIQRIEETSSMVDGSIQVPLGEFFEDKDYGAIVSEAKDFRMFVPDLMEESKEPGESKHAGEFTFDKGLYPADASMYFQVHSRITNHDGNGSYELTGTGHVHLSTMIKRVLQERKKAGMRGETVDFVSLEVPLILNCVSSQSPDAKVVDHVSVSRNTGAVGDLESKGEALYEGTLFVHVNLEDEETHHFFDAFGAKERAFEHPSKRDITEGNFSHVANTMRYHVIRDMAPFIPEFTSNIPISVKESEVVQHADGRTEIIGEPIVRQAKGWVFQPSLKEGERIHAPYNKGTTHTTPGFTYYHDKMMQRLPDTRFILNTTRIVLDRWDMSEKDFIQATEVPVSKNEEGQMQISPKYVDVVNITSEILCAFPTAMNYRGDYADMNTAIRRAMRKSEGYFEHHRNFAHMEHATGLTRVPAVKVHTRSKWHASWDKDKKSGTEMFGDAMMDRSGDCEDFAKLINRVIAGIKSCNTTHPLVTSVQSVLDKYSAYSVLSSVTSASIMTAPDDGSSKASLFGEELNFAHEDSGDEVGSAKDLKANFGAHMFTVLIPKRMEERALEATKGTTYLKSSATISGGKKSSGATSEEITEHEEARFLADNLPPAVLEGTGPARALLLPQEAYHRGMREKVRAINAEMLRIEATARLMTGLSSEQLTSEALREANTIFSPFTLPIRGNTLVDINRDERVSSFYRMPVEMFRVEDGITDERVVPKELVAVQREINEKRGIEGSSMMMNLRLDFVEEEGEESDYFLSRVLPVQLKTRSDVDARNHAGETVVGYTYGINMTDIAHRREDLFGLLKTIRSSEEETQAIDDVMRHANPSMVMQTAPAKEIEDAERLAYRYEKKLNANIDKTLSRGYMGREEDLYTVNLYVRTDNVKYEQIDRLASHLADNGYTGQEAVRVVPESFARGHHLLRLSIPVDTTEAKQAFTSEDGTLTIENNALAENLDKPSDKMSREDRERLVELEEKKLIVKELRHVLSGK